MSDGDRYGVLSGMGILQSKLESESRRTVYDPQGTVPRCETRL
jgi:hypothetical protein